MDTIFINSEKSKTSEPYRLLLSLSDEINFKRWLETCCFIKSWYKLQMEKYKKIK